MLSTLSDFFLMERLGIEGMTEIFTLLVVQMIEKGIIKGNILSVDATIIEAWFKDKDKGKTLTMNRLNITRNMPGGGNVACSKQDLVTSSIPM